MIRGCGVRWWERGEGRSEVFLKLNRPLPNCSHILVTTKTNLTGVITGFFYL